MKIIIAPAKQMRIATDVALPLTTPAFLARAEEVVGWLKGLSYEEAKRLWACSDKLAIENYERLARLDVRCAAELTPAVLAYDGIAYKYMAPAVFEDGHFDYVQERLRILSGVYGALRALDGVVPYRLEMQAKAQVAGAKNLYDYWGDLLYREVVDESGVIVNLASKEYAKCVERHLRPGDHFVTCVFGELSGERVVQKGVYAKMARGDMVRFMAENRVEDLADLRRYDRLGYAFCEERSSEDELVFLKG